MNQISIRLIESVKFEGLSQVQATKCSMGLNAKKNKLFSIIFLIDHMYTSDVWEHNHLGALDMNLPRTALFI